MEKSIFNNISIHLKIVKHFDLKLYPYFDKYQVKAIIAVILDILVFDV